MPVQRNPSDITQAHTYKKALSGLSYFNVVCKQDSIVIINNISPSALSTVCMCEASGLSVNHSLSHWISLIGDGVNTDGNLEPFEHFLSVSLPAVDLSVFDYASIHFIFITQVSTVAVVFLFWSDIPVCLNKSPADVTYSFSFFFLNLVACLFSLFIPHLIFFTLLFTPSSFPVFVLFISLLSFWCMFDVSFCIAQCCASWSFILSLLIFMLRCFIFIIFFRCSI